MGNLRTRIINLITILGLMGLLFGCSRVATDLLNPKYIVGQNLEVKLQFRGNINADLYNYYLVFSNSVEPLLPNVTNYIIPPGKSYNDEALNLATNGEGINYYYKRFFYTWSDYIAYTTTGELYNSGGKFSSTATENAHYNYSRNSNFYPDNKSGGIYIDLAFSLDYLSKMTDKVYFTVVVTQKSTDKIIEILDLYAVIENKAVTTKSGTDVYDSDVPSGADVINWMLKVY